MNDLYWINVIGVLGNTVLTLLVLCVIATIILFIYSLCEISENRKIPNIIKKYTKISLTTVIVFALLNIFIPNKTQLYVIYGVGNVIDYAKNSKEVQKLPDNAVKALNKYLEEVNNDSIK